MDWKLVIAHHEAAHAVTAESLIPGSVEEVSIVPQYTMCLRGGVPCTGVTRFVEPLAPNEIFATILASSRYGEMLVTDRPMATDGDEIDFNLIGLPFWRKGQIYRRAKRMVSRYENEVRAVAERLLEESTIDGESVRSAL